MPAGAVAGVASGCSRWWAGEGTSAWCSPCGRAPRPRSSLFVPAPRWPRGSVSASRPRSPPADGARTRPSRRVGSPSERSPRPARAPRPPASRRERPHAERRAEFVAPSPDGAPDHHGQHRRPPRPRRAPGLNRDPGTGPNTVMTPAVHCLRVSPSAPPQGCAIPWGHRRGSSALSPVPSPAAKLQERGATHFVAVSSAPARQASSSMHLREHEITRRPEGDPRGCTPLLQLRCGRGAGGEGGLPSRVHPSLRERGRGEGGLPPRVPPLLQLRCGRGAGGEGGLPSPVAARDCASLGGRSS